jgi:DNA integrity scanning protein DisA with diadenylate cyclase activity
MASNLPPTVAASALYDSFLQAALRQFFARATFETQPVVSASSDGRLAIEATSDPSELTIRWFGMRHTLHVPKRRPFTPHEVRLAKAIGAILAARYRVIFDPRLMAARGDLFRGAIEDHYVGAFLAGQYSLAEGEGRADTIATAIEVQRVAALSSYENKPISSGVLLLNSEADPVNSGRPVPSWASPYAPALTAIKSFYRLCDGVNTVFLVNRSGLVLDIVEIARWAEARSAAPLPVPNALPYAQHARATRGGEICIVLSPTHEIKVFAEGVQTFTFRNATWHLLDVEAKYEMWVDAVGNRPLAERLFQTALDLADARQGALFVMLREPQDAVGKLIAPADRLDTMAEPVDARTSPSRRDLMYLLANRTALDMDRTVLEALATMDGATVVDRDGRLLAVGAILLHPSIPHEVIVEGARTTAAIAAARFGPVLKVSEDGAITFYDRDKIWEV